MPWYAWILGPPEAIVTYLVTWPAFWRWVYKKWNEKPVGPTYYNMAKGREVPIPPPYNQVNLLHSQVPENWRPENWIITCPHCGVNRVATRDYPMPICACQQQETTWSTVSSGASTFNTLVDTLSNIMTGTPTPSGGVMGQWQGIWDALFGIVKEDDLQKWRNLNVVPPHMIGVQQVGNLPALVEEEEAL